MAASGRASLVALAQAAVAEVLVAGDLALDATLGRGGDSLFLAGRVGDQGRVFAFDIQAAALAESRARLQAAGLAHRVELIQADHACLVEYLPRAARGRLRAAMFNLGYLPGSDKTCITRVDSTLAALRHCADWLGPGGLISVIAYVGHDGGRVEADAVADWAEGLDPKLWQRRWTRPEAPTAPRWLLLRKAPRAD